jgi:hypothetical protein
VTASPVQGGRADAARWFDGPLVALGALFLYGGLAQRTFYKVDGQVLLDRILRGGVHHEYHTFYLPLVRWTAQVLAPHGVSLYTASVAVSAAGMALGVLLFHRATAGLGMSRGATLLAALGFALSPGIVFFATISEVHGAFMPFAALAALAMVRFSRTERWRDAGLAGAALALAYLAHPSGAVMGAVLPVTWWLRRTRGGREPASIDWRRFLPRATLAALVLLAGVAVLPALWRRLVGGLVDSEFAVRLWLSYGSGRFLDAAATCRMLALEWLLPGLPWSVAALGALLHPRLRGGALLLLAAVLPYALASQIMLEGYTERGAYVLPALWSTACVAAALLVGRMPLALGTVALSAALAVAQVKVHDEPDRARGFAAGAREVAGTRPLFLITGHVHDLEAQVMYLPSTPQFYLGWELSRDGAALADSLARCRRGLADLFAQGTCVLLTERARVELARAAQSGSFCLSPDPPHWIPAPGARQWLELFMTEQRAERRQAAGFDGWELTPR